MYSCTVAYQWPHSIRVLEAYIVGCGIFCSSTVCFVFVFVVFKKKKTLITEHLEVYQIYEGFSLSKWYLSICLFSC